MLALCDITKPPFPRQWCFLSRVGELKVGCLSLREEFMGRLAAGASIVRKDVTQSLASCRLPCWRKISGYFGHETSDVVVFLCAGGGGRGDVFPLAVCLVLTFFFFFYSKG